jgi:hypothetical protein
MALYLQPRGSGWDGEGHEGVWFYNFEPASGVPLNSGSLMFDMNAGYLYLQDDDGNAIGDKYDIPTFLVDLPRSPKE